MIKKKKRNHNRNLEMLSNLKKKKEYLQWQLMDLGE